MRERYGTRDVILCYDHRERKMELMIGNIGIYYENVLIGEYLSLLVGSLSHLRLHVRPIYGF